MRLWRNDDNPEEVRFASEWARENALNRMLAYILAPATNPPPHPSERDEEVAAAVVRWLGSPIGQVFLHQCGWGRVTRVGDRIIGVSTSASASRSTVGERVYEVVAVDGMPCPSRAQTVGEGLEKTRDMPPLPKWIRQGLQIAEETFCGSEEES